MFTLLNGNAEKKTKKENNSEIKEARDLFNLGRFPVVTTQVIENRPIAKVLGLVCCRGFDSEDAFFGMAAMAVKKGAQAIIGYNENIAFHPDGSKYFSCFGTAIMFEREARMEFAPDKKTIKDTLNQIPNAPSPRQNFVTNNYDHSAENIQNQLQSQNDTIDFSQSKNLLDNMELNQEDFLSKVQQNSTVEKRVPTESKKYRNQPTEDEDPVLQRLLAAKSRQANNQTWQQNISQ